MILGHMLFCIYDRFGNLKVINLLISDWIFIVKLDSYKS